MDSELEDETLNEIRRDLTTNVDVFLSTEFRIGSSSRQPDDKQMFSENNEEDFMINAGPSKKKLPLNVDMEYIDRLCGSTFYTEQERIELARKEEGAKGEAESLLHEEKADDAEPAGCSPCCSARSSPKHDEEKMKEVLLHSEEGENEVKEEGDPLPENASKDDKENPGKEKKRILQEIVFKKQKETI